MKASTLILPVVAVCGVAIQPSFAADRVKTSNGILETADAPKDGVRSFKGIPFGHPYPQGLQIHSFTPTCQPGVPSCRPRRKFIARLYFSPLVRTSRAQAEIDAGDSSRAA